MKKKATSGKERQAKYLAKIKADPLKYELHKKKERERWARNSQSKKSTEQEKRCKRKYWREAQRKHRTSKCIESTISIMIPKSTMSTSEIIINSKTNSGKKLAGRRKL